MGVVQERLHTRIQAHIDVRIHSHLGRSDFDTLYLSQRRAICGAPSRHIDNLHVDTRHNTPFLFQSSDHSLLVQFHFLLAFLFLLFSITRSVSSFLSATIARTTALAQSVPKASSSNTNALVGSCI
jgi:hypothetical protein